MREIPYKSGAIFKLGGLCQPVNQGEKILEIHPLGWIKNKMPIAIVMWGIEINGTMMFFSAVCKFIFWLKIRENMQSQ